MRISPVQITSTKVSTPNNNPSFKGLWSRELIETPNSGRWPWQKSYICVNRYFPFADDNELQIRRAQSRPPSRFDELGFKNTHKDMKSVVKHKVIVNGRLKCTKEEAKQYMDDPNSVSNKVYAELGKFKDKYGGDINSEFAFAKDSLGDYRMYQVKRKWIEYSPKA